MDLHTMTQSSSFVHLRTARDNLEDTSSVTTSILNLPDHQILTRMMQEVPECLNMLQYCIDRLTKRLEKKTTDAGVNVSVLREAIIYLLVYGFVPFCLDDDSDDTHRQTRLQPRILHSTDVLWETKMFDIPQGHLMPCIQSQLRHDQTAQQPYIYFYRPSASLSSVFSMFRKVMPAYRALLAVREYNVMVRRKNATRTLLVNRTLPPPEPQASYDETSKADFMERSILETATRVAVDQTNMHIEQDKRQVTFVKDVVNKQKHHAAQQLDHPQYENLLVMPPLCNTVVDHHYTEEIDELNYIDHFRQAFSLIFKIQDLPDIARTDAIRRRARSLQNVQHTNVELGFIEPDINEFVGLVCALQNDKAYQKRVSEGIVEQRERGHRQQRMFFPLQILAMPDVPEGLVLNTPGQRFEVLLNLFDRGMLKREDFATVFRSEIGFELSEDAAPLSGLGKKGAAGKADAEKQDLERIDQGQSRSRRRQREDESSSSDSDTGSDTGAKQRRRRRSRSRSDSDSDRGQNKAQARSRPSRKKARRGKESAKI